MTLKSKEFMDDICATIFFFLVTKEKFRFNELYEALNGFARDRHEKGISKPTLNVHLNHLTKKNWVIRHEESHKNVTYEINYDKFYKSKEFFTKISESIKEDAEEKKRLFSLSVEEQVEEVIRLEAIRQMEEIKLMIRYLVFQKEEDGLLLLYLQTDCFKRVEYWLIDSSLKNEETKNRVFNKIDELIKKFDPQETRRNKLYFNPHETRDDSLEQTKL